MTRDKQSGAELKACPFCGGNNVELYSPPLSRLIAVRCTDCEVRGETAIEADMAASNWNTRSLPQAGEGVDECAREILNRHTEYMDGLARGQVMMKTSNALAAVKEALNAHQATAASYDELVKHMTQRFLSWKLPADFNPDGGITAKRPNYAPNVVWEPSGTNLLDYTQAEAMVRHMLEGSAIPPAGRVEEATDAMCDAALHEWKSAVAAGNLTGNEIWKRIYSAMNRAALSTQGAFS